MKDFLLVFRSDLSKTPERSPEEMQAVTKRWMDWIGSIAAQNKLTDRGNRLFPAGKVLKPGNVVTDGPYTEIKESVGGYSMIKADSLEEATGSNSVRSLGAMMIADACMPVLRTEPSRISASCKIVL